MANNGAAAKRGQDQTSSPTLRQLAESRKGVTLLSYTYRDRKPAVGDAQGVKCEGREGS